MSNSLKISHFSSLNFSPWKHDFEKDECYIQRFSVNDVIRVQLSIAKDINVKFSLFDYQKKTYSDIALTQTETNDDYTSYFFLYKGLSIGKYRIQSTNELGEIISYSNFAIQQRDKLKDTIRFRYTHRENDYDVLFTDGDINYYFDFRVEGGFLYSELQFLISNNSFRDQGYVVHQLSASPYEVHNLTLGTSFGVPVWVGRKVNLIFSLSDVTINGNKYTRSESAEVELVTIDAGYPLYVFKLAVEPDAFFSYKQEEFPGIYKVLGTQDKKILGTEDSKGLLIENTLK